MHTALLFRLYLQISQRTNVTFYQNGCAWDGNGQCGADTQLNFCCLRPLGQCAHIQQGFVLGTHLAERASRFGYFEFHAHAGFAHTCTHVVQGWCRGESSSQLFSIAAAIIVYLLQIWSIVYVLLASGLHGMNAKFIGGLFVHLTLLSSPNLIGAAGWWPQRGCR